MQGRGRIIVVSAPSGAGKTTLLDHILRTVPNTTYSISATTRAPRPGEVDGRNYFFCTRERFEEKIREGELAEWQIVHGNYYGTPRAFIERTVAAGRHVVMDIDVYGKKKFDLIYPDNLGILILPPSLECLERRLRNRGTDSEETIRVRLANAREEMAFAREQGRYEYTIINDDLDMAKERIVSIVTTAIEQ